MYFRCFCFLFFTQVKVFGFWNSAILNEKLKHFTQKSLQNHKVFVSGLLFKCITFHNKKLNNIFFRFYIDEIIDLF